MTEEGKCNEILSPEKVDEYDDSKGGGGHTGGSCICGKPKDHEENCECKLCGKEW